MLRNPWLANRYPLDLTGGYDYAANFPLKAALKASALVSRPETLAVIDYRTVTEPNLDSTVELTTQRAGTIHGLHVWFDAEIAEGIGFSNAPGEPLQVYGQTFLPLIAPVKLAAGAASPRASARL